MSEAEVPTSSSSMAAPHPGLIHHLQEVASSLHAVATAAAAASTASGISNVTVNLSSGSSTSSSSGGHSGAQLHEEPPPGIGPSDSGEIIKMDTGSDDNEPLKKKLKTDTDGSDGSLKEPVTEKLENRLGGILCCAVCLDLPKTAIYQCQNGHLMCAGCFTHLLADCRLRDETATCPNCRVEISKHAVQRNLAVEKAVSELPDICQYCSKQFPRHSLDRHENDQCIERTKTCKFARIGCPWRGPFHELKGHEMACIHPSKSGAEVMDVLIIQDQSIDVEKKLNSAVFDLLSIEKITFQDLQLKPYRTDEFVHKLYYETSRFSAFNNQFVVKARITSQQRDPTHSCDRQVEYQLILKTKPTPATLDISFVVLKGPFGDMKLNPKIHKYEFSEQNTESTHFQLPLVDSAECNRVLAAKTIQFSNLAFPNQLVQFTSHSLSQFLHGLSLLVRK